MVASGPLPFVTIDTRFLAKGGAGTQRRFDAESPEAPTGCPRLPVPLVDWQATMGSPLSIPAAMSAEPGMTRMTC